MTATQITCDFGDSSGNPLVGYVRVTLDSPLDNATTEFEPVSSTTNLVAGACTLNLAPSDTAGVTYKFEVRSTANGTDVAARVPFHAIVPASATPIPFVSLTPTGVSLAGLENSLSAITNRLYNSSTFWAQVRTNLFSVQGTYNGTVTYSQGMIVYYQGGSYLYTNTVAGAGHAPTVGGSNAYWQIIAAQGSTGSGNVGDDSPYDPTGWDGSLQSPSKNAVRDKIETLATQAQLSGLLVNATLTAPVLAADPVATDRTSKIPSTTWVQNLVDTIRAQLLPVGICATFPATAVPSYWVPLDGRTLNRTTYAALFAILGTAFNTGGEAGTVFRLPDWRGRVVVGMDNISAVQGAAGRIAGAWASTLGGNAGEENHVLTTPEMPSHSHTPPAAGTSPSYLTYVSAGGAGYIATAGSPGLAYQFGSPTATAGSGTAHNNIQPSIAMVPMIFAGV